MKTYTVFLNFIRPEDMETDTYLVKVTANNPKDAQTQAIQYIESLIWDLKDWRSIRFNLHLLSRLGPAFRGLFILVYG